MKDYKIFFKNIEKIWLKYMELDGITKVLSPTEFLKEMDEEEYRVKNILQSSLLSTSTVGSFAEGGLANYFIINEISYGGICSKCGTDGIVVLLIDKEYTKHLDTKIFLPSLESYMVMNIYKDKEELFRQFAVPINPETDLWYCPNCKKLHRFKYTNNCGLEFDQENIK